MRAPVVVVFSGRAARLARALRPLPPSPIGERLPWHALHHLEACERWDTCLERMPIIGAKVRDQYRRGYWSPSSAAVSALEYLGEQERPDYVDHHHHPDCACADCQAHPLRQR